MAGVSLPRPSPCSDASLSSHPSFQGKQLKVHGVLLCVGGKRPTLRGQGGTLQPWTCARTLPGKEGLGVSHVPYLE